MVPLIWETPKGRVIRVMARVSGLYWDAGSLCTQTLKPKALNHKSEAVNLRP